jgi:hypothetical protein
MPIHALRAGETANGDKYVEVELRAIEYETSTGTDAYGEPTYPSRIRMYLDDVPGGPSWPPARIDAAVAQFQAMLPQGLWIVNVAENPGKAHIDFTITRENPN